MTDGEWESRLAEIRLSRASEKLDDRMTALFAGAAPRGPGDGRGWRRSHARWLLPLLGATCALAGILWVFSRPQPAAKRAAAVTIVRPNCTQSQIRLVRLLLEPRRNAGPSPEFTVSIVTK